MAYFKKKYYRNINNIFLLKLVRSVKQSAFLKEWGAQLIYGDLTIPETIPACLCGVTAVIDASTARPFDPYPAKEVDMIGKQNLLKAIEIAKIDRFIFFSLVNIDSYNNVPLLYYKKNIERTIQELPIKYTIFRLAGFYQGLINQYCIPILDQQPIWLTTDSASIAYMDTQDIAKFVIKSLSIPLTENQIISLTGKNAWSSEEIVDICQVLSGQQAKINRIPLVFLQLFRKMTALFEWSYNISDRLAFTEVLVTGKPFVAPMEKTYILFKISPEETIPLEKYLQDYFSKILKKIKELNYDQRQKRNDIKF
jgi:uncharacterized protein YbjT (DUF2867 family)